MDAENVGQDGIVCKEGHLGHTHGFGSFPGSVLQILNPAEGDVVEHEGGDGFAGIEAGLEDAGNKRPEAAAEDTGDQHDGEQ